jgi:uncharacterized protein (DUF433 family)
MVGRSQPFDIELQPRQVADEYDFSVDSQCDIIFSPHEKTQKEDRGASMSEIDLMRRITLNPAIFGGKPIIRGRRLAVEHVLGMLAAGDTAQTLLEAYPWLEPDDIRACLLYARKVVGEERFEPLAMEVA